MEMDEENEKDEKIFITGHRQITLIYLTEDDILVQDLDKLLKKQ
jgi:hypothetical protein